MFSSGSRGCGLGVQNIHIRGEDAFNLANQSAAAPSFGSYNFYERAVSRLHRSSNNLYLRISRGLPSLQALYTLS